MLKTGPSSTTLSYDPLLRLHQVASAATIKFAYDGLDRIAEYNASNALQRRYVHGPGMDEPIVWYEGTGTTNRRFLSSDERGSIVSVTDSAGALLGVNRYDEYGQPQSGNLGAFGYTGQAWLPEIGEWYYKARVYDPELGRFLQADPIGGTNLYSYVGNDPANFVDPSGMTACTGSRVASACANPDGGQGHIAGGMMGHSSLGYRVAGPVIPVGITSNELAKLIQRWQAETGGYIPGFWVKIPGAVTSEVIAGEQSVAITPSRYEWVGSSPAAPFFNAASFEAGLGTPKNWINTPPQFFSHVAARHFGADDRFASKFTGKFQNPVSIFRLAQFAANRGVMRPGDFPGTFTYTARYSGLVGYQRGTGQPTNFVTLVVQRLGTFTAAGRPEYNAITMYPGW